MGKKLVRILHKCTKLTHFLPKLTQKYNKIDLYPKKKHYITEKKNLRELKWDNLGY